MIAYALILIMRCQAYVFNKRKKYIVYKEERKKYKDRRVEFLWSRRWMSVVSAIFIFITLHKKILFLFPFHCQMSTYLFVAWHMTQSTFLVFVLLFSHPRCSSYRWYHMYSKRGSSRWFGAFKEYDQYLKSIIHFQLSENTASCDIQTKRWSIERVRWFGGWAYWTQNFVQ